jgi:hypothetical protein
VQAIPALIALIVIPAIYAAFLRLSARLLKLSGLGWYYAFPFAFLVILFSLAGRFLANYFEFTAPAAFGLTLSFLIQVGFGAWFFRNRVRTPAGSLAGWVGAAKLMALAYALFLVIVGGPIWGLNAWLHSARP